MVKNSPANAGNTSSIPGPGRFHTQWSKKAHVPQPLSWYAQSHALQQDEPLQWEAHTAQRVDPAHHN